MNGTLRISKIIPIFCLLVAAAPLRAQLPGTLQQTLTIDDAVRYASERNLSITQAQSSVENAAARITSSFGSFLPQVTVQGGYTRQLTDGTIFVQGTAIPGSRSANNYQAQANASVQLFDGFNRTSVYSASQSTYNATIQELNRTRQQVTFQARSAFLNALRAAQLIDVRRTDLEVAREQLERTRGRVEAGAAQMGTIYTQEAEIANAELALEQARTEALVARNNLAFILDVDPASELKLSSEGLANSIDSAEIASVRQQISSLSSLLETQRRNRPDLRAAEMRVEAARSQIAAARSGYYPSISAGVGYGWNRSDQTSSSDAQFNLNFLYTPFDGFRTSEQVQLAEAQLQGAEIDLRRQELQARSDLQQALARMEGAERQLHAAEKAVAAARQSRFAADERYKVGVGQYSDYLLASAQYLNSQINLVNAVFNFRLALYEIRYHLGE
jgi:outer membrane protein